MKDLLNQLRNNIPASAITGPIFIILILAMMILPLPPMLLDVFFTFNIGMSLVVLLTAMRARKALDFLSFPSVLLLSTLLRLSLNVASSRAVLMEGHTGPDAAGKVIESFANFLIGGNYAVGIVVFMVLTIINFVVITKGATRIAEVAARFTLDAMPGKQMAIDADLNAGMINEQEARKRRSEVAQEAEFYGSMDGASKFVRGDAIAAILILAINLIGGLIVGIAQHQLSIGDAASNYTLLAIGDGLVAQIPGLMISTAAGLMVSRVSAEGDISQQMAENLLGDPKALFVTGGIIGVLGLIPGMPHLAFLLMAAAVCAVAWGIDKRNKAPKKEEAAQLEDKTKPQDVEVGWNDVPAPDTLGIEVGYRLLPMMEPGSTHEVLQRIKNVRKKFAQEVGFLPATVHVRDNLALPPNKYRIMFKGVEIGSGDLYPDRLLAICGEDESLPPLPGEKTKDPTFGMPAVWVFRDAQEQAEFAGYAVVEPGTVITTHLSHIMRSHAQELLGREEVQQLVDHIKQYSPKLIEDVIPKLVPLHVLQKVLQNLLSEGLTILDVKTVIENLAEHYGTTQDTNDLTRNVRVAVSRAIAAQVAPGAGAIPVMTLSAALEGLLMQAFSSGGAFDPQMAEKLLNEVTQTASAIENTGGSPILVVPSQLRQSLSRFLRRNAKGLSVLSTDEIPDGRQLKITHLIGETL